MNFYEHWVLPPLLDLAMRQHQLGKYRWEVLQEYVAACLKSALAPA